MNRDELKVPSQRADRPGDDRSPTDHETPDRDTHDRDPHDRDPLGHDPLDRDADGRADQGADVLADEPYRDPYARTGEDVIADPDPAHRPEDVHVAGPVPETEPARRTPDRPEHETPAHSTPGHETPGHETPDHDRPGHERVPGHEGTPEPVPATAVAGEPPAHAAPQERALFDQDPAEVQARWRDLQTAFVDDPGEAVQRADGLVGEVVETLTSTLNARTGELRERWKGAGDGDTEQLRLALREYRGMLEQLLALTGSGSR
ncbi:hypothetical protein [Nonomuraea ceibae]|uniref:hypothetical protein n=1 Tax=Nonomuraea ceibae TaxID=1935170 RepID=UPI001C5EA04D|nr:hypothetical protein [Nonomuraea ceibae]